MQPRDLTDIGKPDGTLETIYGGDNAGVYEWKEGKKIFKRKLNKKDLDKREKAEKEYPNPK